MKLNRFIAMTIIALFVVGAMGVVATRSFALGSRSPTAQISTPQANACAQEQSNDTEVSSVTDTDNINLQCGDQSTPDGKTSVGATDTDTQQVEQQVGNQTGPDTGVEAPETTSPSGN